MEFAWSWRHEVTWVIRAHTSRCVFRQQFGCVHGRENQKIAFLPSCFPGRSAASSRRCHTPSRVTLDVAACNRGARSGSNALRTVRDK